MNHTVCAAALLAVLALSACNSGEATPPSTPVPETPASEFPEAAEATPTPTLSPEPEGPDVYQVGELITRKSADIVVNVIEERDSIPSDFQEPFTPGEGERLWYVEITWTNNLPEAVAKECHGPDSMDLRAFDIQGREMLMVDQPGYIRGQNCSTGLMQGQSGRWLSAFRGPDEDFGWLLFDDYNDEVAAVTLDPNLDLRYTN